MPLSSGSPRESSEEISVVPYEGSGGEWDGLLEGMRGSTFCHRGGWREIMVEVLGHDPHYRLALNSAGEVQGLLPQVRVRSRIFGDYLVSMPFLSYGGPLGTEAARSALARAAAQEASDLGVDLLELRARWPVPGDLQTSERKITVLLPLPPTATELWEDGLKAKVRSQVRRPMKEGMEVRLGTSEITAFYQVFAHTMRDLGTPVLPRAFFQALVEAFPEELTVCVVYHGGRPVAGGCGFLWQGEMEITWAGALRELSRLAPNMLLYWSFMEHAIERGARTFNFGRCSPGSGTHRFKRQWGGEDVALPWAQWSRSDLTATPTPTGRKYELATAVWRRLPLTVANRFGPFLSRSLP